MEIIDNGVTYRADTVEELVALYRAVKGDGVRAYDSGQEADKNGWIVWEASAYSRCPVPKGKNVEVILSSGIKLITYYPKNLDWSNIMPKEDIIVRYRIID